MRLPAFISNRRTCAVVVLSALLLLTAKARASTLESMDAEVSSLYEKSKDAIVKVHAEPIPLFNLPPRAATGFFIDNEGRLITSASLVENAAGCWVEWQERRFTARIIGVDSNTKLALLQIDTGLPTPTLPTGNYADLRVGSMVVAIGFPLGWASAPAVGSVTGIDIKCGAHLFPVNHIRASCRLRQGQGGGPLFNARGEVVGIIIAALPDDQCYALPICAARKICNDLLEHGQPQYGYVGLSVTERQCADDLWRVIVQEVTSNSPAAAAGFHDSDILLRICNNDVRRSADVLNTMFYHACGATVSMTFLRNGETQEVDVIIGHRPNGSTPSRLPVLQPNNPFGPVIVPVSAESPQ